MKFRDIVDLLQARYEKYPHMKDKMTLVLNKFERLSDKNIEEIKSLMIYLLCSSEVKISLNYTTKQESVLKFEKFLDTLIEFDSIDITK